MMMDAQRKVADSVTKRGYRDGWTAEQFLARQIAKMAEELKELSQTIAVYHDSYWLPEWKREIEIAGRMARTAFDNQPTWTVGEQSLAALKSEAADMQVVLFNIAAAISEIDGGAPFDVVQAAVDKAAGDEGRGVKYDL